MWVVFYRPTAGIFKGVVKFEEFKTKAHVLTFIKYQGSNAIISINFQCYKEDDV